MGYTERPPHPSPLPIGWGEGERSALFLGMDVGRKHDLCVIDVGEKIGDVVWDRVRLELKGKTFSEIESELYRLLKLPRVKRACIDATGMGMQLAEQAKKKFGWKVEPVTFTAPMKEELAFGLRRDFEDRNIPRPLIVWPVSVRPGIGAFGLGMLRQVEYFDIAFPDRLALKDFMHGSGFDVNGPTLMQAPDCRPQCL